MHQWQDLFELTMHLRSRDNRVWRYLYQPQNRHQQLRQLRYQVQWHNVPLLEWRMLRIV